MSNHWHALYQELRDLMDSHGAAQGYTQWLQQIPDIPEDILVELEQLSIQYAEGPVLVIDNQRAVH